MFQRGRGKQIISHKAEVLTLFPNANWYHNQQISGGAIYNGDTRISEVYNVAWRAWESAYCKNYNAIMQLKKK